MTHHTTRRRSSLIKTLGALVAGALIVAACGGDDDDSAAATTLADDTLTETTSPSDDAEAPIETAKVRVAADSFLLGTLAWVAQDQGFFEENGIEADVSMFGTGIEAIQGVIARQADVGHALDFAVLNLVAAADENMSIIGAIAEPKPGFHSLAVRKGITGPQDLVGKKIGYVEGTSEHFVTIRYLQQNGISLDDVELVSLPGLFELVGALKTNDVQAGWTWLDGTNQAAADDNIEILTTDADVLGTTAIYVIAETTWANENADVIERLLKSYNEAATYIASNIEDAAQIVADGTSGDAGVYGAVMPNQNFKVEFTQPMLDALDSIAAFLIESGKLDADFDVRGFFNLSAMEAAVPGSVTADLG